MDGAFFKGGGAYKFIVDIKKTLLKDLNHQIDGKNNQIEGFNSRIYGSSGGLFERGGLLTICCSRVGDNRGEGLFRGGGPIREFTVLLIWSSNFNWSSFVTPSNFTLSSFVTICLFTKMLHFSALFGFAEIIISFHLSLLSCIALSTNHWFIILISCSSLADMSFLSVPSIYMVLSSA